MHEREVLRWDAVVDSKASVSASAWVVGLRQEKYHKTGPPELSEDHAEPEQALVRAVRWGGAGRSPEDQKKAKKEATLTGLEPATLTGVDFESTAFDV